MPCNSDYMEPTRKELQLRETAQLLMYVYQHAQFNSGVGKVDAKLKDASKDIYCKADYVPQLCEAIHVLTTAQMNEIVYNGRDPMSRKLADWWERHLEADRSREAREAREAFRQATLAKLTPEERGVLGV